MDTNNSPLKMSVLVNVVALLLAIVCLLTIIAIESQQSKASFVQTLNKYAEEINISLLPREINTHTEGSKLLGRRADNKAYYLEGIRQQFNLPYQQYCQQKSLGFLLACLQFSPSEENVRNILEQASKFAVKRPNLKGERGNAWLLALAVDQLSIHATGHEKTLKNIKEKLSLALETYLTLLDGNSASLWHSRFSLASDAFTIAVVVADENPIQFSRAHRHFMEALAALEITEAWPNGYNYWINNRAFPFLLASSAYIYGTDGTEKKRLLALIEKVGLWHIYMTRPDNRIAAIGDDGPRVDLKDETRKVIDFIAYLTKNPVFATYSQYLKKLHGNESYYRSYRWMPALFYDPTIKAVGKNFDDLSVFNGVLPTTAIFGKGAYNQVVMRSGWGKDDAFIQIRGGDNFSHHQHQDAGHFTVYYRAPLIVDAAVYDNNYFSPSRLNFSLRSVAKNTLLLPQYGQYISPNKFFKDNVNPGGQRIVFPTGSAITSVSDWKNNTHKYQGATLLRQYFEENTLSYVEYDLTNTYRNIKDKAERVVRGLLYIPKIQTVLVFDEVLGVDNKTKIKTQLHLKPKALVSQMRKSLVGDTSSFSSNSIVRLEGHSTLINLLTEEAVEGRSYEGEKSRFMVESYSETTSEFVDQRAGYKNKKWFDNPSSRIEWSSVDGAKSQSFVQVVSLKGVTHLPYIAKNTEQYASYILDEHIVIKLKLAVKSIEIKSYEKSSMVIIAPSWMNNINITNNGCTYNVPLNGGLGYDELNGC